MIRALILFTALGLLSACEQYREPKANCFNLVSRGPSSLDCDFTLLPGLETVDKVHD